MFTHDGKMGSNNTMEPTKSMVRSNTKHQTVQVEVVLLTTAAVAQVDWLLLLLVPLVAANGDGTNGCSCPSADADADASTTSCDSSPCGSGKGGGGLVELD